ncbi:toll/interleukin-1 receptor domain-containing protein [Lentzea sp. NPDC058436]|uniref:toll/interleukin-1 receptor domain-containing protein n=1 Tax=Lentzea sp. NPDC058436 TaxID=3346499 RepID=UPI00365907BB
MTSIFLCYRSAHDAYVAAYLDEKLSQLFGRDTVFRATRSVAPGESYDKAIMGALESCRVMLVIIGPTWRDELAAHDDAQEDWVRTEITKALAHDKKVIPVLLSRTPRLTTSELPPDMIGLAMQQHVTFEHREPEADLGRLVAVLERALGLHDGETRRCIGDGEFTVLREPGDDGKVEVDVVQRNTGGSIVGRLTGRVRAADLPRMAAFLADLPKTP